MNVFARIRERVGAVIGAVIGSIFACACGLFFTFYLAPQQKLEATRIENMPVMDAGVVVSTAVGEDVLFTGYLVDNPVVVDGDRLVAYQLDQWDVTEQNNDPDDPSEDYEGTWETIEKVFPDLMINIDGNVVRSLTGDNVTLSGPVHETLVHGQGSQEAKYNGEWLPEGSQRFRGFYNGDLITVLGKKAATDGVVPEEYYAGDRVSFVEYKHDEAKAMLYFGMAMLACSPVVLIGGTLTAIFGRKRTRIT